MHHYGEARSATAVAHYSQGNAPRQSHVPLWSRPRIHTPGWGSSDLIWRLMALWVTWSFSAAWVKLWCRAAAKSSAGIRWFGKPLVSGGTLRLWASLFATSRR